MKHLITPLSFVVSFVPIILAVIAYAFLLPDVIPTHWSFSGEITEWSPKSDIFLIAGILTFANLLCAFFTHNTEAHIQSGIVHGVRNPTVARIILFGTIVFVDVVFFVVIGMILTAV